MSEISLVDKINELVKNTNNFTENDELTFVINNLLLELDNKKNNFFGEDIKSINIDNAFDFQNKIYENIKKLNSLTNNTFIFHQNFFKSFISNLDLSNDTISKCDIFNTTKLSEKAYDEPNSGDFFTYINLIDKKDYVWEIKESIKVFDKDNFISFFTYISVNNDDIAKTTTISISFRGTYDFHSAIMDIQILPIKFNTIIDGINYEYYLHNGFSKVFSYIDKNGNSTIDLIFTKLLNVINSVNNLGYKKDLIINGHSLGAAQATIFLLYLFSDETSQKYFNTNIFSSIKIYNYGQPRITTDNTLKKIFNLLIRKKKLQCYSFLNNFDIVSTIPPFYLFNYTHAFENIHFFNFRRNTIYTMSSYLVANGIFINIVAILLVQIKRKKYIIGANKETDKLLAQILYQEFKISIFSHYINNYNYFLTNSV